MINKKSVSRLLIVSIFLLLVFPFVSSVGEVCCQKLTNGNWCQNAPIEECDSTAGVPAPTSCEQTSYCSLGTCIDTDKGSCMPNTPKLRCEVEGGSWDPRAKSEIEMCQNGCCLAGDTVAFVSQTECKQLATDYSMETIFREDIDLEQSCFEMSNPYVKGACVTDSLDCSMETKEDCLSKTGNFNEDFLCTATHLGTNCAKTENTRCGDDGKVYFLDSCGNFANIYNSLMFTLNENAWTPEMENYWTSMTDSTCSAGTDCGNCNYIEGSTCKEYDRNNPATPTRPKFGENVCADLSCYYDTNDDGIKEEYSHGESWCAESLGTYPHIEVDPIFGTFKDDKIRDELLKVNSYNLPGSRYYKLNCMDGEVIVEPCRDYRNEYCVESSFDSGFGIAQCKSNNWRDCTSQDTKTLCEDSTRDCKWLYGYRFDFAETTTNEDKKEETQGSCVPFYAPGFNFWEEGNDATLLCDLGSVQEHALYETSFWRKRSEFKDQPACDTTNEKDAVSRCIDNCYAIPEYGMKSSGGAYFDVETLVGVHQGESPGGKFENYCISDRKGYYCDGKTGGVVGSSAACTENSGRALPIFLTHEAWLDSIRERARSLGDCGYKENILGKYSKPESEAVSVIFQILKQDMQTVKENGTELETIYVGDSKIYEGYR